MSADTRRQILDSARYLREVRPLDPAELAEYVEGGVHPAVVRQVLRESADELEIVEREAGTFVPVPDGPFVPDFHGVSGLPTAYQARLEDALVEEFGVGWATGETGNRLRNRLRAIKAAYFAGEAVEYDRVTAFAYAIYHLPRTYAATQYVLHELGTDGLLKRTSRVLDVGAGVGGPALGLVDYWFGPPENRRDPPPGRVDYHAVEPGGGAELLVEFLEETDSNVGTTIHREPIESHQPDGRFDIVLLANVLSELADPEETAQRCLEALDHTGTVVAIAPADRETATGLRRIERSVRDTTGATIYAPTAWLWRDRHPTDDGWSFDRRPDIAVPSLQEDLAAPADRSERYRTTAVQFAYTLLRTDGRRRHDVTLDRREAIPLGDLGSAVTERVDAVASKLSPDLRSTPARTDIGREPDNPVYLLGDGSQTEDCFAVAVRETSLNDALGRASYGALLRFENVLVLWNDDEGAYNLVVDEETIVDVLGRGAPAPDT